MTVTVRIFLLLLAMAAVVGMPTIGAMLRYHGSFPSDFFIFPAREPLPKMPFSWWFFGAIAVVWIAVAALYVFPGWFGFKKSEMPSESSYLRNKKAYPRWFWVGFVMWGPTLFLLWSKITEPAWFIRWSGVPLYWGAVLMIDGWVYVRNEGISLVSKAPQELIGIGIASIPGWLLYECFNFFVGNNWYYPYAHVAGTQEILLCSMVVSSSLFPFAFEWFCLLNTFDRFRRRFSNGPRLVFSKRQKNMILVTSLLLLLASGWWPDYLFPIMWVAPPILLAVVLNRIGIWTPFDPIARGNWSLLLVFAVTYFIEGFFLEFQNFFTGYPPPESGSMPVPLYWKYRLPLINDFHVFEMPVLGFIGYIPFSLYCWLWWIACATLVNAKSEFQNGVPFGSDYPR